MRLAELINVHKFLQILVVAGNKIADNVREAYIALLYGLGQSKTMTVLDLKDCIAPEKINGELLTSILDIPGCEWNKDDALRQGIYMKRSNLKA